MKSLLTAIDEGRLVELPDPDKQKSLEYLALLIEAIPDLHAGSDIVQAVKERELAGTSALGKGIACPHARKAGEGELLCAVGWSPQGIDFNAPDGEKVRLLIMYYIPDSQRNVYLKEISGLAKAVTKTEGIGALASAADIHAVRNLLLDWIAIAIDAAIPDAKARMVRLQGRQAVAQEAAGIKGFQPFAVIPFSAVLSGTGTPLVLSRDAEFVRALESDAAAAEQLKKNDGFEMGEYQIAIQSSTSFASNRTLVECIAVKLKRPAAA